MRRALRKHLPALSRIYGLNPSYWDDAPQGEVDAYLDDYRRYCEELKRQAKR